jgi:hypothetical protein
MAIKLLFDAGLPVNGCDVLVLCDNPFASFLRDGLVRAGARVEVSRNLEDASVDAGRDAVLVALLPNASCRLDAEAVYGISQRWPGTVVAQFWGDIDREALENRGVDYWPRESPARGHMGILPSEIGPDIIVRLQAAGLKVGELLNRSGRLSTAGVNSMVDPLLK